jgi:hypothetical protein
VRTDLFTPPFPRRGSPGTGVVAAEACADHPATTSQRGRKRNRTQGIIGNLAAKKEQFGWGAPAGILSE